MCVHTDTVITRSVSVFVSSRLSLPSSFLAILLNSSLVVSYFIASVPPVSAGKSVTVSASAIFVMCLYICTCESCVRCLLAKYYESWTQLFMTRIWMLYMASHFCYKHSGVFILQLSHSLHPLFTYYSSLVTFVLPPLPTDSQYLRFGNSWKVGRIKSESDK